MSKKILATCWTSAGSANPWSEDDRSPADIEDRLRMIYEAGFKGLGLRHGDLMHVDATIGWNKLKDLIAEYQFENFEIEFLEGWFEQDASREHSDAVRTDLLRAAETLPVDQIKVGPRMSGGDLDIASMAEEFATLCDQAKNVGTRVGLEPMPFSNLPNPDVALEVVKKAGRSNGGLFIDSWHVIRGDYSLESLASIPVEHIVGVELADAKAEPEGSLLEDTLNNRVVPGEGSFDLHEFVKAVEKTGYDGPWGVEVISEEFRDLPIDSALAKAFAAASKFIN